MPEISIRNQVEGEHSKAKNKQNQEGIVYSSSKVLNSGSIKQQIGKDRSTVIHRTESKGMSVIYESQKSMYPVDLQK